MITKSKFYVVYGDPIPLARARCSRGKFYDSQKHTKLLWGIDLNKQHNEDPLFIGPLEMNVIFYLPIPKNTPIKHKDLLKDQWHSIKPDSSNLLKFVEDVATSICYKDDCVIVKQSIEKVYDDGKGPRTEFVLCELKDRRLHRELK